MITREFLENYPLNRKLDTDGKRAMEQVTGDEEPPTIRDLCSHCGETQTFRKTTMYPFLFGDDGPVVVAWQYSCAYCKQDIRVFLLEFNSEMTWVRKRGQWPAWKVKIGKRLEKALGLWRDLYIKGAACESESFGIGAFIYYRRVVDGIVDELLSQVSDSMNGEERVAFDAKVKEAERVRRADQKLDLVKDVLPESLKPEGMNPLSTLYGALSADIHAASDEECLEVAETVRTSLEYLFFTVQDRKLLAEKYVADMRGLARRRAEREKMPSASASDVPSETE